MFNLQKFIEKTENEFRERFDEFVVEKNGRIVASEESVLQFFRSAIETAVEEVVGIERQRLNSTRNRLEREMKDTKLEIKKYKLVAEVIQE